MWYVPVMHVTPWGPRVALVLGHLPARVPLTAVGEVAGQGEGRVSVVSFQVEVTLP
jgi:hypothetical protein